MRASGETSGHSIEAHQQHAALSQGNAGSRDGVGETLHQNRVRNPTTAVEQSRLATRGTGRRPRATMDDWGGSGLDVVLRSGASIQSQGSRAPSPGRIVCPVPQPSSASDLSEWGGSLGDVLLRPPSARRQFFSRNSQAITSQNDFEGIFRDAEFDESNVSNTSVSRLPPRPSNESWGGDLGAVLATRPPRQQLRSANTGAMEARSGSDSGVMANRIPNQGFQPASRTRHQTLAHGEETSAEWAGGLSLEQLLPPRRVVSSAQQSSVQRESHSDTAKVRPMRARSVVMRRKDAQDGDCCPICLDEFKIKDLCSHLPCGHRYHRNCIRTFLDHARRRQEANGETPAPSCPCCRADLSNVYV